LLKNEVEALKDELSRKYKIKNALLGNSASMLHVHAQVETVAKNRDCALVLGETGSGKKVVAKAIHYNSPRMKGPFVELNAGIIPREYLESELFGHEKGAFPEAISRKIGKIEEAGHGTLFISDITELDMGLQGKLLKVLKEKQFFRIGGKDPINADIHFICSANKSLEKEVISGNFREDLHKHIVDNTIELPPLRERGSDIILLANHFLDDYCNANGMGRMTLSLPAKEKLLKYYYPGNVRELKAITELSAITSYGQQIYQEDIHFVNFPVDDSFLDNEKTMKEYTSEIIKFYLKKYENNVIKVAEKLDIGKSTVYRFIHKKEIRASNMLK
jgi:DNA-binding NtrC family response regulator